VKAMLKQLFSLSLASAMAFASVVATAIAPQAALATHRAACGAQTQYGFASHGRASSQGKRIDGIRARFEPLSIELCYRVDERSPQQLDVGSNRGCLRHVRKLHSSARYGPDSA
jgi:hypothetical protein